MNKHRLSAIEVFLIAATIFVVIFVGYAVWRAQQETEVPIEQIELIPEETAEDRVPEPPEIESAEDLDEAIEALDRLDSEAGSEDAAELEAESEGL